MGEIHLWFVFFLSETLPKRLKFKKVDIYMFKVKNKSTRTGCEICSKLKFIQSHCLLYILFSAPGDILLQFHSPYSFWHDILKKELANVLHCRFTVKVVQTKFRTCLHLFIIKYVLVCFSYSKQKNLKFLKYQHSGSWIYHGLLWWCIYLPGFLNNDNPSHFRLHIGALKYGPNWISILVQCKVKKGLSKNSGLSL